MMNDEMMWNFDVNENHYENFLLASIFDPPHLKQGGLRGTYKVVSFI